MPVFTGASLKPLQRQTARYLQLRLVARVLGFQSLTHLECDDKRGIATAHPQLPAIQPKCPTVNTFALTLRFACPISEGIVGAGHPRLHPNQMLPDMLHTALIEA